MVDFARSVWEDFYLEGQSLPERESPGSPLKRCLVTWLDLVCLRYQERMSYELRG